MAIPGPVVTIVAFLVALGLLVFAWPARGLLIFVFVWKVGTEAFRPLAGEPIWEFIERGGSYAAPLALAWLQRAGELRNVPGARHERDHARDRQQGAQRRHRDHEG